jgi:hypothetical protein
MLRNVKERDKSDNSFLLRQKNVSRNAENQLWDVNHELHLQDKKISYISFHHQRSNSLAFKFLRRLLFYRERNSERLLLSFISIEDVVYAIESFKFTDYRDEHEKRLVDNDWDDFSSANHLLCKNSVDSDRDDFFKCKSLIIHLTY